MVGASACTTTCVVELVEGLRQSEAAIKQYEAWSSSASMLYSFDLSDLGASGPSAAKKRFVIWCQSHPVLKLFQAFTFGASSGLAVLNYLVRIPDQDYRVKRG